MHLVVVQLVSVVFLLLVFHEFVLVFGEVFFVFVLDAGLRECVLLFFFFFDEALFVVSFSKAFL